MIKIQTNLRRLIKRSSSNNSATSILYAVHYTRQSSGRIQDVLLLMKGSRDFETVANRVSKIKAILQYTPNVSDNSTYFPGLFQLSRRFSSIAVIIRKSLSLSTHRQCLLPLCGNSLHQTWWLSS